MLNCREITEMSSDYLDGELPWWSRMRVRLHLAVCRHCAEYVRQVVLTVGALGALGGVGLPDEAKQDLLETFRAASDE